MGKFIIETTKLVAARLTPIKARHITVGQKPDNATKGLKFMDVGTLRTLP